MPAASTNRWDRLDPPEIGNWSPRLRASVVIPYFDSLKALRRTLIGLAAQTYPADLTEIIVVDDGTPEALEPSHIQDLANAQIVTRADEGFRLAAARNDGAKASAGHVVVFLDHDMLPDPQWLESHMRWHHVTGRALVLGNRSHVDDEWLTEEIVRNASNGTGLDDVVDGREVQVPEWIEFHLQRTSNLTSGDEDIFRVVTGGNLSVSPSLFDEIGGFDESFVRWGGEDTELGFRAWVSGALLIPEPSAHCWHQGLGVLPDSTERLAQKVQQRKLAHLIPIPGFRTRVPGRIWQRPRVLVEIQGDDPESVIATADSLFEIPDVMIVIDSDDPLLIEDLNPDPRVEVAPRVDRTPYRFTPFHARIPAGLAISEPLLENLVNKARVTGKAATRDGVAVESRRHVNTGALEATYLDEQAQRARRARTTTNRILSRIRRINTFSDVIRTVRWLLGAIRRRRPGSGRAASYRSSGTKAPPRSLTSDPWSRVVAVDLPSLPATGTLGGERTDLMVTRNAPPPQSASEVRHLDISTTDRSDLLAYPPISPAMALSSIRDGLTSGNDLSVLLTGTSPDATPPGQRTGEAAKLAKSTETDLAELESIRRAVLAEHLPTMRLSQLRLVAGLQPIAPTISVVMATRRSTAIASAVESVLGQSYPDLELILATHGVDLPAGIEGALRESSIHFEIVEAPADLRFGSVLAMASRRSAGDLIAKMDDDDLYSSSHVEDLVNAYLLSGADLVGKAAEFVYLEQADTTVHRFIEGAYTKSRTIAGGAMAITRAAYERVGGWADVVRHVDQALIRDVVAGGGSVFRTHGLGYVLVRHGDHTWQSDEHRFMDQAEETWSGLPNWILADLPPDGCQNPLSR